MRFRILAGAAIAALIFLVIERKLPAPPDSSALVASLRDQVAPFRFTLATDPEPPERDTPTTLRVYVIDAAGDPADGLTIEADVYMSGMDHGAQHGSLQGIGHGNYEGEMVLEMAGSWNVDLTATRDGKLSRQRLSIEVTGERGRTPRNPNEDAPEP